MVETFKYRGETFARYDTTTGCTDEIPSPVMLETSDRFGDGPLQFCDYLLATSPDWEKPAEKPPLDVDEMLKVLWEMGYGITRLEAHQDAAGFVHLSLSGNAFRGVTGWIGK